MTALRFQAEGHHEISPTSLRGAGWRGVGGGGVGGGRESKKLNNIFVIKISLLSTRHRPSPGSDTADCAETVATGKSRRRQPSVSTCHNTTKNALNVPHTKKIIQKLRILLHVSARLCWCVYCFVSVVTKSKALLRKIRV